MRPAALAPPFFLVAGLLVAAGIVKMRRPRPTAQAISDAGLPSSDALGRAVGAVEIAAGVLAIVGGAALAVLSVSALYLAFAGFLAYVMRAHPEAGSCGCAGARAVPPSRLHLVLNLIAAATGVAYALAGARGVVPWFRAVGPTPAILALAGLSLAGWLCVVVATAVPAAWSAWTPPEPGGDRHPHDLPGDRHLRAEEALATSGIGPGHASLWPGVDAPDAAARDGGSR